MQEVEQLSTLFSYELELLSTNIDIQYEDLLGQPITVRLDLPDDQIRYFNGLVNRFAHTGFDGDLAIYSATLVLWTWFLTRTADCRIFQEQKEIFREHGYTDFDFISWLMEQEDIYYYFKHEDGKHTLGPGRRLQCPQPRGRLCADSLLSILYYPPNETGLREQDHIHDWSVVRAVRSGTYTHTDFDFTAPRKNLRTKLIHPNAHRYADLEIYDYPGAYQNSSNGEQYTRVRIEAIHAGYETARGVGNARGIATGALLTLNGYPREDQNREYLIVSADYRLQSDAFGSSDSAGTGPVFQCRFTALDVQPLYRPSQVTPIPQVKGP